MTTLVMGGAGFIGSNVADRLLALGERVRVFDNLSRPGSERNVAWLRERHGDRIDVLLGDVCDPGAVADAVRGVDSVFHFAAQVAVTTSLVDPIADFEVNARGTLNVLEAVRRDAPAAPLVYTSTNKVYGALEGVALRATATRHEPVDPSVRARGIPELRALSFHTPYGCSKGTADQCVLDYARTFGLRALVFRMSCIYGPRQLGTEDQGWVAHLIMRALRGQTISIYGDGRQVRDVLFVDDLVDAFVRARGRMEQLAGRAFNIGGGPRYTLSLMELVTEIERLTRQRPTVAFHPWRPSDQRWYVSDTSLFENEAGWRAQIAPHEGVRRLFEWLRGDGASITYASGADERPGGECARAADELGGLGVVP